MRVTTIKDMHFSGYGVTLKAGENELSGKVSYGLRCSLRRHKRNGSVDYEDAEMEQASRSTGQCVAVSLEEPAVEAVDEIDVALEGPAVEAVDDSGPKKNKNRK